MKAMTRTGRVLAILCVTLGWLAVLSLSATDPIIGSWTLDPKYGTYEEKLTFRSNGTLVYRIMGTSVEGSWTRVRPGVYRMKPAGKNDYLKLASGRLEMWDADGFVRAFTRD